MERDLKPFELHEVDGRNVLQYFGGGKHPERLEPDKVWIIFWAMEEGYDIDLYHIEIMDSLDVRPYTARLRRDDNGKVIIEGNVSMKKCTIIRSIHFSMCHFTQKLDFTGSSVVMGVEFSGSHFDGKVNFSRCSFGGRVMFDSAFFNQEAYFDESGFAEDVCFIGCTFGSTGSYFRRCTFEMDANFMDARLRESFTFDKSRFAMNPNLDKALLCEASPESLDDVGWAYRRSALSGASYFFALAGERYSDQEAPEYSRAADSFRDAKVEYEKEGKYDEAGEMYVREKDSIRKQLRFRKGERLKWIWFWIWRRTCDYGEKPWRFIRWVGYIILFLAVIYSPIISRIPVISGWLSWWPFITFKEYPFHPWSAGPIKGAVFNIMTALYFSVVTFCTLGFGDISPVSIVGKFWTVFQVLLGYLIFGVLITLVARKMTRS